MVSTLIRKPKAQTPRTIVRREEQASTIYYYIQQGEHTHEVTIENGKASCNCHAYSYSPRGNKRCGDTDLAQQNEQERGTDLQQHVAKEISAPTCIKCWRLVKHAGDWCGC